MTRYSLTLRLLPGRWHGSPESRVKRALKCLLRGFGLQVTEIKEVVPTPQEEASVNDKGNQLTIRASNMHETISPSTVQPSKS